MATGVLDVVPTKQWSETLSGAPVFDRVVAGLVPATVRRWTGIAPQIEQAALDNHFISVHLGGAKRLFRCGEGSAQSCEVASGAHSVVPAGAAFQWNTEGPVDFAHIYFEPKVIETVIASVFDRNPAQVTLEEGLGGGDPMIAMLAISLLDELADDDPHQPYVEDVVRLLVCQALRLHSDARSRGPLAPYLLAPFRLRRALDFIESNLAEPIGVAEIAAASGVSPYHFSRAFRQTTGKPPYAYLLERRVTAAKAMLADSAAPLTVIARLCGFGSLSQFSRIFRGATGGSATLYRQRR